MVRGRGEVEGGVLVDEEDYDELMEVDEKAYKVEKEVEAEACVRRALKTAIALRGVDVKALAGRIRVECDWLEEVLEGEEGVEMPVWLIGSIAHALDFSVDFLLRLAAEHAEEGR